MDMIDLRSDFLARPTPAMLRAGALAASGPQCFGLREDPWQRRLEARIAKLCGMEDALVFPTCTMANTTALLLATQPGSMVLTQPDAHVLVSEAGAGAAWGGLLLQPVEGGSGGTAAMPALSAWQAALEVAPDAQRAPARLCVLENSHNRAGGVALPLDYVHAVVALAQERHVALHLDGARLFFAAAALGVAPATLTAGFGTASLSLNKTLGAPVAALLAGSAEAIARALPIRQRLGGGLRPTAAPCAASFAGLDGLADIPEVLAHAAALADGLQDCPGLQVRATTPRTNLVVADLQVPEHTADTVARLESRGLRVLVLGPGCIRFALYRGIDRSEVERAIAITRDVLS